MSNNQTNLPYAAKPVAFPELEDLRELFTLTPYDPSADRQLKPVHQFPTVEHVFNKKKGCTVEKPAITNLSASVMCINNMQGGRLSFFTMKPTQKLIGYLAANMLLIEYDSISVEIIIRDDDSILVTAHYSKILGSRWLVLQFDGRRKLEAAINRPQEKVG